MKILLIDSHKGTDKPAQNLHWLNAQRIKNYLESVGHDVNFIWSYPTVNDNIDSGYDRIIFNHTSRYSYISDEWITQSPDAKILYITNEYNLGEPLVLWSHVKQSGKKYDVIANHPKDASKVVGKYVDNWHSVNLNSLITVATPPTADHEFFSFEKTKPIYYGSFRKDRSLYYQKYLTGNIVVSTHAKNRQKFIDIGVTGPFINRIDWTENDLSLYKTSLYIEDVKTHKYYNYLANRFYEALNHNTFPLFDKACANSVLLSGYDIPSYAWVDSEADVAYITKELPTGYMECMDAWRVQALAEKQQVLQEIHTIIIK